MVYGGRRAQDGSVGVKPRNAGAGGRATEGRSARISPCLTRMLNAYKICFSLIFLKRAQQSRFAVKLEKT